MRNLLVMQTYHKVSRKNWISSCYGRRKVSRKPFIYSGILGFLGLTDEKEKEPDKLTTLVKKGILAVQHGNYELADKIFHMALKLANDLNYVEGETHIMCLMANLSMERGFHGQAERLFTDVLKRILSSGEAENSNAVVEISLKLALIFAARGDLAKAEQGFLFCLGCQKEKLGNPDSPSDSDTLGLAGMVQDKWAQYLLSRGRLGEAAVAWKDAVSISSLLYGEDGDQTLIVKNSYASLLSMQGKLDEASTLLEEVVSRSADDSVHLSTFLVNLGVVRMKMGLTTQAHQLCLKANSLASSSNDEEAIVESQKCIDEVLSLKL